MGLEAEILDSLGSLESDNFGSLGTLNFDYTLAGILGVDEADCHKFGFGSYWVGICHNFVEDWRHRKYRSSTGSFQWSSTGCLLHFP